MADAEQVIRDVMDRWKAGIDAHEPHRVAELFAADGIFQGLRPYSVGRQGVIAYYDSQPDGLTVVYRILETRSIAADTVLGYLQADFTFPDESLINVNLGVLLANNGDGWRIRYYQASRIS